ncbi:hypothetical protein HA402_006091 [Bradysia odoriphaga]|nr:hypothetical protein HA402_006091 [Bradysia odoriphaga]
MQNRLIVLAVVFFVFKISSCFAETVKEPMITCLGCPGCPGCPEPVNPLCQPPLCLNHKRVCLHGTYTPRDSRGCPLCPICKLKPKEPMPVCLGCPGCPGCLDDTIVNLREPVAHCLGCPGCPGCPPDN